MISVMLFKRNFPVDVIHAGEYHWVNIEGITIFCRDHGSAESLAVALRACMMPAQPCPTCNGKGGDCRDCEVAK